MEPDLTYRCARTAHASAPPAFLAALLQGGIGAAGWAALQRMPRLLVLALGSLVGPRLLLPLHQLPRQLQCLSLLRADLQHQSAQRSHPDTDTCALIPTSVDAAGACTGAEATAAGGSFRNSSTSTGGGGGSVAGAATDGAVAAPLLPPGLKQLTLRFSHTHPEPDAHTLLGIIAGATQLLTLELCMSNDRVGLLPACAHPASAQDNAVAGPAAASQAAAGGACAPQLSPCACAWRQLSSLRSLEKLQVTLPEGLGGTGDVREMVHEVCRGLRGVRHLSIKALAGGLEVNRSDAQVLCSSLTSLSVLELGVIYQKVRSVTQPQQPAAGHTHHQSSGASTSQAAAAKHAVGDASREQLGWEQLGEVLAVGLPHCRWA